MKDLKVFSSTLIILILTQVIVAQFPATSTYQSITTPNITMPDNLHKITDNSVPSPVDITRITDYYEPWDWYPIFEYPKIQVWNANQTRYRIRSWKVYDAKTHLEVQDLSGSIYPSYWSNTNPDLIYSFKEDGTIKKYFVSSNTEKSVDTILGYEIIKLGPGEGNIDNKDNFVALVGKNGLDLNVIIYDLQKLKIEHTEVFSGAWENGNSNGVKYPKYIDWVSVSQSGKYVGIMWDHNATSKDNPFNGHFGLEIYNTTDMQFRRRIADYGNHGDFGYAIDGREVFVQFWGPTGSVSMYYLDNADRVVLSNHPDLNAAGHISCRNIKRPGWAYLTISSQEQTGQIIALKLDNSGLVEHFGHHFSSNTTYDNTAMGVPSPDGTKVMFKSDFGNISDQKPAYCFEVTLANASSTKNNSDEKNSLLVYPNPAHDYIFIKSTEPLKDISIYNQDGQLVKYIQYPNSYQVKVNLSNIEAGFYILRASTEETINTQKIIIN